MKNDFTNIEIGVLLEAVGAQMRLRGLTFAAALDGCSNADMRRRMIPKLGETVNAAYERADQLLALVPEEILGFLETGEWQ